jgi:hypothetical protein
VVWASKPPADDFRVWAQNALGVPAGMRGGMWRHREAYVEMKQSREEPVPIRCLDLKMDHFASGVKWFGKISKDMLRVV